MSLDRDPQNEGAWVERIRAMKILEPQQAYAEIRRARNVLPRSRELEELEKQAWGQP
jgi:hypothetical protein